MRYYASGAEREAAIASGEATRLHSTLQDGEKHYAVMKYWATRPTEVRVNLTGTEQDNLPDAIREAERWDYGPLGDGMAGYGGVRIS